jgi:glycosyltransferase involved in cell wall biosynthesis
MSSPSAAPTRVPNVRKSVSIVMPCLNEAETLESCVRSARSAVECMDGEVIVADNGSTDGSPEIATRSGARVVRVDAKGYGSALTGGIQAANGEYIVMLDADGSYNFADIPSFVEKLDEGYDLVMGNRFSGGIKAGAMPPLHRYLGNPVLTGIGRLFFGAPCRDFHCGMRAFKKSVIVGLDLRSTGMEYASEMVVKATLSKLRIGEIPTSLSPDGRTRAPHLRTWHDGWRHLRFLLLYSPRWLFLYPGLALLILGTTIGAWLLPHERRLGPLHFDVNTMMVAALAVLVGFQAVTFATFTKVFGISEGLLPPDPRLSRAFKYLTLELGLILGTVLLLAGFAGWIILLTGWAEAQFGPLDPTHTFRIGIPSSTSVALGVEIILSSFFLSVLGLRRR